MKFIVLFLEDFFHFLMLLERVNATKTVKIAKSDQRNHQKDTSESE